MNITEIQTKLQELGFNPGEIDGVWGRQTIAAVKLFQTTRGLKPDGIVGPLTARVLAGKSLVVDPAEDKPEAVERPPLVWFEAALSLIGTKEKPGAGSNPTLINWAKDCNIDYKSDDIAWCGLFVAHCIGSTLPEEALPNNPLGARNWQQFGQACKPMKGAILVFWRGKPKGAFGHVGFYRSEDSQAYHVVGGNQSDSVNTCRVAKSRLLAARWPRSAASLSGEVVIAEGKGKLSHNEA
jgi:uncharacterized protein (TIGR02594 family)